MTKHDIVEKAKTVSSIRRPVSEDESKLAVAWMKDEIGLSQVVGVKTLGAFGPTVLARIAVVLRDAYRKGRLKIQ